MANPFNPLVISNIEKVGTQALKFSFENGFTKVVNNLIWIFIKNPDGTSQISISQDGASSTIGVYGQVITPETPIPLGGTLMTDPADIESWLITNLIA